MRRLRRAPEAQGQWDTVTSSTALSVRGPEHLLQEASCPLPGHRRPTRSGRTQAPEVPQTLAPVPHPHQPPPPLLPLPLPSAKRIPGGGWEEASQKAADPCGWLRKPCVRFWRGP